MGARPLRKNVLKSLWREGPKGGWFFLCPHCRAERRLPRRPTPGGANHYLRVALAAAFFTLATWSWLEWKGILSFLPIWIAFEVTYRTRVRADLRCRSCGFDPLLYLVDVQKAREEIREHWKKKFEEKGVPFPQENPALAFDASRSSGPNSSPPSVS